MAERQKKKKGQPESPVPNMIFDQIQVMAYMYADREEWDNYILAEMQSIIDKYGAYVSLSSIGFPENWSEMLHSRADDSQYTPGKIFSVLRQLSQNCCNSRISTLLSSFIRFKNF